MLLCQVGIPGWEQKHPNWQALMNMFWHFDIGSEVLVKGFKWWLKKDRWNIHEYKIMFARWKRDIHKAWKWYMQWNTCRMKYAKVSFFLQHIFFPTRSLQWERYTNNMKLDECESLSFFWTFCGPLPIHPRNHVRFTISSCQFESSVFQASEMEEMAAPLGLQNGSGSCVSTRNKNHDLYLKTHQLKVMCSCSSSRSDMNIWVYKMI